MQLALRPRASSIAPFLLAWLAACQQAPTTPSAPVTAAPPVTPQNQSAPASPAALPQCPACPVCPQCPPPATPTAPTPVEAAAPFRSTEWSALPNWMQDELVPAWPGLLASCRAMRTPEVVAVWSPICEAAQRLPAKPSSQQVREFLQSNLQPWQVINADGSEEGLVTGYYEPLLRGSRTPTARYNVPVLGVPDDMVVVDLAEQYADLKGMRLRGRLEGRKLVPYWSRADIEKLLATQRDKLAARTLLWVEDEIELFFLQVQGSGRVALPDGRMVRLAYADQNGHPYQSIGRWLVQQGELKVEQASMQGIQAWAKANPTRLHEMLNANPSYVFFREEVADGAGPKGSLGVPLAQGRAIAIDPRTIPLGAPVFLATTQPDGNALNRLVMAQDTGGAIRGRVRADFFWGFGADAGRQAGRMRQQGRMWLLWPRNAVPPGN